ncbi:MAG: rRNA maturation RNase YbeY [Planctomycetes bacterium]|nr:rRNA maturation RNase YbeY [Planctomycetota bacterium]
MSRFEIDITDQQRHLPVPKERLRDVIQRVLVEERISSAQISLALVDDAGIHRLNREFLQHDYPTDVISFLLTEPGDLSERHLEGELVVSTETAIREAESHGWTADDELLLYVVHGLLHLCGYDDLTDEARPAMRVRERQMLALWQLTPTGLEA